MSSKQDESKLRASKKKVAKKTAAKKKVAASTTVATKKVVSKKATVAKKAVKKVAAQQAQQPKSITYSEYRERVAMAAYYIAERRPFDSGLPEEDWALGEAEVQAALHADGVIVVPD
jgi:hypothetical protein